MMRRSVKNLALVLAGVILISTLLPCDIMASEEGANYDVIIDIIEDKLRSGEIQSAQDVRDAIEAAENQYGVTISDSEVEMIVNAYDMADKMGVDGDTLADMVEDVYENNIKGKTFDSSEDMIDAAGKGMIDSAADKVAESWAKKIKDSIFDFFNDFKETIISFFTGLFD